jgi:hypothetical protein
MKKEDFKRIKVKKRIKKQQLKTKKAPQKNG